jgi:hypothetical protein
VSVVVHHLIDPALAEHRGNHHAQALSLPTSHPIYCPSQSITRILFSLKWFFNGLLVGNRALRGAAGVATPVALRLAPVTSPARALLRARAEAS